MRFRMLAGVACAGVLALSGCGAVSDAIDAATQSTPPAATTTMATQQLAEDTGGEISFNGQIGQCVNLGGTVNEAEIELAACGSQESNYKIIGKAPTSDECLSDVDMSYYETEWGTEQGAVCLDLDWVMGQCMDTGLDVPVRVACSTPGTEVYRAEEVLQGTADQDGCASGGGFEYTERKFVVCLTPM